MSRTKRKPSTPQPPPSSKPQLPLAVHESVAEIERRTKRLLEGCRQGGFSFNVSKATEILRTCAVDAFDKQAEYYTSLKTFVPQWLDEIANQTVTSTLALLDIFDLSWGQSSEVTMEQELRRTLQAHLEQRAQRVTLIARLPKPALIRMEAATAAFMAEYLPKLEREAKQERANS